MDTDENGALEVHFGKAVVVDHPWKGVDDIREYTHRCIGTHLVKNLKEAGLITEKMEKNVVRAGDMLSSEIHLVIMDIKTYKKLTWRPNEKISQKPARKSDKTQ